MSNGLITLSLDGRKGPTRKAFDWRQISDLVASAPALTITLMVINVILFGLMVEMGGSTNNDTLVFFGAQVGPLVKRGEWWRLLTSTFLHIGVWHLVFNMWALFALGSRLEPIYGAARFAAIYFTSAISGSLLGLWAMPLSVAAGASGAIFGIAGAMLVLGTIDPSRVPGGMSKAFGFGILPFLVYNLAFAAFWNLVKASNTSAINIAAHIGGAVGGIVCALALKPHDERPQTKWLAVAGSSALVLSAFVFPLHAISARGLTLTQLRQNQRLQPVWALIRSGKIVQAQAALGKLGDSAQNSPDFHVLRALFLEIQHQSSESLNEYYHVVQMAPNYAAGHRVLGLALLRRGRLDEAIAEQREAVRLDDTAANSHFCLGQALFAKNRIAEAANELHTAIQLNPQWSEPHQLLAVVLAAQGKLPEAQSERAWAARLAPKNKTTGP